MTQKLNLEELSPTFRAKHYHREWLAVRPEREGSWAVRKCVLCYAAPVKRPSGHFGSWKHSPKTHRNASGNGARTVPLVKQIKGNMKRHHAPRNPRRAGAWRKWIVMKSGENVYISYGSIAWKWLWSCAGEVADAGEMGERRTKKKKKKRKKQEAVLTTTTTLGSNLLWH